MRGVTPLFALLAILACALVLAEEEGQPMTEYLKEGILRGGRRGSTAAGAYSWGNNDGASSNRAGNDEEDDEDDLLGEPNALNENQILRKRNNELEARTKELEARTKELEAQISELRPKAPQANLDLARDVGEAAAAQKKKAMVKKAKKAKGKVHRAALKAKWSEDALKVAKLVNDDWAESTDGEARCKALLAKAKECHKKGGSKTDCELTDRTQFQTTDWVKKRFVTSSWENANWYRAKGYNNLKPKSVLVHRAGLHALANGHGHKSYVCASWTAVCTMPDTLAKAQCRSARVVLGGSGYYRMRNTAVRGYEWIAAKAMAKHNINGIRIVLPQFG